MCQKLADSIFQMASMQSARLHGFSPVIQGKTGRVGWKLCMVKWALEYIYLEY